MKLYSLKGHEARPASGGVNVAKTLSQTVVFWGVFLFVLPAGIYWLEEYLGLAEWRFSHPAGQILGVLLFIAAGSLGVTSSMIMAVRGRGTPMPTDCARELVILGPYRYIRNPMALAGLAQGVAVGLFLGSPAIVFYSLCGGPAWNVLVRPWEELDLEQRFGEPFRRYRAAVRCWIPRILPYRGNDVEFPTMR